MPVLTADFEGGTNGATIATADAGSQNAWDVVATTTGATRTYTTAQAAHGTKSASFATGTTVGASSVKWSTSLTASAAAGPFFCVAYLFLPSFTKQPVPVSFMSGSTTNRVGLRITLSGTIAVLVAGVSTIQETSVSVIPASTWVRVELKAVGDASVGSYEMRYFATADSPVPSEVLNNGGATVGTGGTIDSVSFGITQGIASVPTFEMDDIGASDAGFFGPKVGNYLAGSGFFGG